MSTTLTKGAPAQPAASKAAIPAIPFLSSSAAQPVAIGHALLLGALFVWRFNALVTNPVSTLQTALPVVVLIQAAYVILCLPVAGSQNAKATKKSRPGEKKKADGSASKTAIATAVIAMLLTGIVTPLFHILFVLFGAPFLTHISHTFLCCAHFNVLALFPVLYVRGSDPQAIQAILGASAPFDSTFGGLVGATIGAWLGAVPIPLDWDREWQKWPVTIVVGTYLGYIIGTKVIGTVFYGKRWATPLPTAPKEE